MQSEERKSSISQATTYEEMGLFWDSHDFVEFDNPLLPDVKFEIRILDKDKNAKDLKIE